MAPQLPSHLPPHPRPLPLPASCAPCSTCLYLAGRLQPQACSRPSSLRTCSRTWRYCSRFCSRRAEDVQSLAGGTQVISCWPALHGHARSPRPGGRTMHAPCPRSPNGQPGHRPLSGSRPALVPSPGPSKNTTHRIPHFCSGAKILVSKLRETRISKQSYSQAETPRCRLPVGSQNLQGHRGVGHSLG